MNKRTLLWATLWQSRWFLLKCSAAGLFLGLILMFSLPNEYETSIFSVIESTVAEIAADEDYTALVASNIPSSIQMVDAVRPTRYHFIMGSVPFLTSMFDIPVVLSQTGESVTLYQYMTEHQRYPWWKYVTSIPKLFSEKEINIDSPIDIFHLTDHQAEVADAIKERINVDVDRKLHTVTLTVRMQDPLVAATVADSISARIQAYVRKYRIQKESYNIVHLEEVHNQAKEAYYKAQKIHAHFVDKNHDLATLSARKELTNLRIEKDITYSHYVKTRRQLQAAKSRAVIERPVYSVIEPATVPITPASPRPVLLILVFTLLFVTMGCVWILWGKSKYILLRHSLGEKVG